MKNVHLEKEIKKLAKLTTFSYEMCGGFLLIIGILLITFLVNEPHREKVTAYFVLPTCAIILIIHIIGRYTKIFRKKVLIDWYLHDLNRIKLFEETKKRLSETYEKALKLLVQDFLKNRNSTDRTQEIKIMGSFLKKIKMELENRRDLISEKLKNDDLELIKLLELKGKIDQIEERLENMVLDHIIEIQKEEDDPEIFGKRIEPIIRLETESWVTDHITFYDKHINSCKKSVSELRTILEQDYQYKT